MNPALNLDAASRIALQAIEHHLFTDEETDAPERANPPSSIGAFAAMSHPEKTRFHRSDVPLEASTSSASSAPHVTVNTIQQYLREKGHTGASIRDSALQIRLNSANLSPQTFLAALQIVHTPGNPLLVNLAVKNNEHAKLIARLEGMTTTVQGFGPAIRVAALNANNDPIKLVASMLAYVRNSRKKKAAPASRNVG